MYHGNNMHGTLVLRYHLLENWKHNQTIKKKEKKRKKTKLEIIRYINLFIYKIKQYTFSRLVN